MPGVTLAGLPDDTDLDAWAQRYRDWLADRKRISEQEASGNYPYAEAWQDSDDQAVELLHQAAALLGVEAP